MEHSSLYGRRCTCVEEQGGGAERVSATLVGVDRLVVTGVVFLVFNPAVSTGCVRDVAGVAVGDRADAWTTGCDPCELVLVSERLLPFVSECEVVVVDLERRSDDISDVDTRDGLGMTESCARRSRRRCAASNSACIVAMVVRSVSISDCAVGETTAGAAMLVDRLGLLGEDREDGARSSSRAVARTIRSLRAAKTARIRWVHCATIEST